MYIDFVVGELCPQRVGRLLGLLTISTCLSAYKDLNAITHDLTCAMRFWCYRVCMLFRCTLFGFGVTTLPLPILLAVGLGLGRLLSWGCLWFAVHQFVDGSIMMNSHLATTCHALLDSLRKVLCRRCDKRQVISDEYHQHLHCKMS